MSNTGFDEGPPKAEIITLTSVSLASSVASYARGEYLSLSKPHAGFTVISFPASLAGTVVSNIGSWDAY